MLQKPEKGGYNRLNRRQVLQILGVGMGALAVGGCTSKLFESEENLRSKLIPLSKGTLVATPRGLRSIEQIQAGDEVYTWQLAMQKLGVRKVKEAFKMVHQGEVMILEFETNEEIRCTPLHRFYTGQWVPAQHLRPGDKLLNLAGSWTKLKSIGREKESQPVFNLHVDGIHNYFVGREGILVHNSKTP